jgi:hypothetical protein
MHWKRRQERGCDDARLQKNVLALALILALAGCHDAPRERVLFDFEAGEELDRIFWQCRTLCSLSKDHATQGSGSLKMVLFPSDYPGFAADLTVRDWRRYRELRFDIYNPSKRIVPIEVRIDDGAVHPENGDWFGERFLLQKGMNHISIPFGTLLASGTHRRLDLKQIRGMFIYLSHPPVKSILYIDSISLRAGQRRFAGEHP